MRSALTPVFANDFISNFENRAPQNYPNDFKPVLHKQRFWTRMHIM